MQIELSSSGVGGKYEDWWSLVFDENNGNFYIEHRWDHAIKDSGTERITLAEAKSTDPHHYEMAVKVIREMLFSNPPTT